MFKLTDPFGSAPTQAPFAQSVSRGVPWHNLPVTREYTLGQLLDQTIAPARTTPSSTPTATSASPGTSSARRWTASRAASWRLA